MGLIIAVLLAVTAGILVISTPHAAATGNRLALAAIDGHAHGHASTGHEDRSSVHDHVSAQEDCGDPASGTHSGGAHCCGMSACHAVQAIATPVLHSPCTSAVVITVQGDEQVDGVIPGSLDRPPRTA
jgi:hypothetical protein